MKRTLTISLLLFFLADAVGFIFYLFVDWYEVKKEMTHFLASEEYEKNAVTLTLDKVEFEKIRWIEVDHEFYYNNKLYDMSSLTRTPDQKTKIRCVEDPREADFFEHLKQMVDQDQSDPNHQRTFILSVFKFLSGLVFQLISFPLHGYSGNSQSGDTYLNHYQFTFNSILVQPPNHDSFSI